MASTFLARPGLWTSMPKVSPSRQSRDSAGLLAPWPPRGAAKSVDARPSPRGGRLLPNDDAADDSVRRQHLQCLGNRGLAICDGRNISISNLTFPISVLFCAAVW